MKNRLLIFFVSYLIVSNHISAQSYVPLKKNKMLISDVITPKVFAVPIQTVKLLAGPFKQSMEADAAYLLKIEPDRLLSDFRIHAGLKSKGERYGGWENSGLAGHTLGHYMSACALQYISTGDKRYLVNVNYIVDELAECQPLRNGYIGAIPKEDSMWAEVQKGNIRSKGFDLNGAWSPWYTVHKIMAGLLDAYLYCNNTKALRIQKKFADWSERLLANLNDEQLQHMLQCEYGGMNETLVNTYALTKDKRYLDLSYKFHDRRVLDSLAMGKDILPGKHSNTQIPKLIGSIRRYELTGNIADKTRSEFFWNTVVKHHTYAAGGNSNYEYFGPADELNETLTDNTMETCNTYNMLKLTRHLFALDPKATYFDFYENGLYNHILSSQNHDDGMMCYFVPLRMGSKKHFSNPFNTFTCCVGSGMENHVKYGEAIYAAGKDGSLYINLFIPSELEWTDNNRQLKMESSLPENNKVKIIFNNADAVLYTLKIRKPKWAIGPIQLMVNGKETNNNIDVQGYLNIKRSWKKNDIVEIKFPMSIYTVAMPDNRNRQAFFYGPTLLAGDFGNTEPDQISGIPVLVSALKEPFQWLQQINNGIQFRSVNVGHPTEVNFKPFNKISNEYYSVYFDVFSPEGWKEQQAKYEAERQRLKMMEQQTIDALRVGEMQPERDHEFIGDTYMGEGHGRKWRTSRVDGSMFFVMKVDRENQNELLMTYWGMDNRGKIFDILVDGQKIATEDLNKYKASRFYDVQYAIPLLLTKGKEKISIQIKARPSNSIGPLYGTIRTIKKND